MDILYIFISMRWPSFLELSFANILRSLLNVNLNPLLYVSTGPATKDIADSSTKRTLRA